MEWLVAIYDNMQQKRCAATEETEKNKNLSDVITRCFHIITSCRLHHIIGRNFLFVIVIAIYNQSSDSMM